MSHDDKIVGSTDGLDRSACAKCAGRGRTRAAAYGLKGFAIFAGSCEVYCACPSGRALKEKQAAHWRANAAVKPRRSED